MSDYLTKALHSFFTEKGTYLRKKFSFEKINMIFVDIIVVITDGYMGDSDVCRDLARFADKLFFCSSWHKPFLCAHPVLL